MWRRPSGQRSQDRASAAASGIGEILRRRRETLGLSLEDVHDRIRVPLRLLEAIEADRFEAFGIAQYAKGFVRSYAQFLGLDPDPFVARVHGTSPRETKATLVASGEVPIRPVAPPSPLRRALVWTAVIVALVVGTIAYIGYRQIRQFYQSASGESQPVAAGADGGGAAAVDGPSPPDMPATGIDTAAPRLPALGVAADSGVRLEMSSQDVSWVRVSVDGSPVFEGFLRAGERRRWEAARSLSVVIGNAAAVRVSHNGRDLGALGAEGEVVRRTFASGPAGGERSP